MLGSSSTLAQETGDAHSDGARHPNHVAFMVGAMTPLEETDHTSFAIGVDYERAIAERWGVGVGADFAYGDHDRSAVAALGAAFYATPQWKLATGPGGERVDKAKSDGTTKTSWYFLWFVSTGYAIHAGETTITPLLIVDFVGETKTNLTLGVSVGLGW
jgi:hypothetical protein